MGWKGTIRSLGAVARLYEREQNRIYKEQYREAVRT